MGVIESCIALTAPVEVPVVDAANSAEAVSPNRTSLPSIAAPAAAVAVPPPASSAHVAVTTAPSHSSPITVTTASPWRVLPTIRPNIRGRLNGITSSRKISNRLIHAVGFSNGCAELAL